MNNPNAKITGAFIAKKLLGERAIPITTDTLPQKESEHMPPKDLEHTFAPNTKMNGTNILTLMDQTAELQ